MRYQKEVLMIDVKNKNLTGLKFIDLFAGLGGFRLAQDTNTQA